MRSLRHVVVPLLVVTGLLVAGLVVASPASAVTAPRPTVTTTSSTATVSWPAVPGADRYALCLVRTLDQTSCTKGLYVTGTSYRFTGLTAVSGTDYHVHVRAFDGSASASSPRLPVELGAAPGTATPPQLTITTGHNTATVSWKPVPGASRYAVCLVRTLDQTSCTEGFFTTQTSHTFTGLLPTRGFDYHVHVRAYVGSTSAASPRTGIELTLTPDAPSGVRHSVSTSSAVISWTAARYATSYDVCVMTFLAATTCEQTTPRTTATSTTLTGLTANPGADYVYVVRAHRGEKSADSARGRFDMPVGTTSGAKVTATTLTSLTFTWNAATNAEAYVAQVSTRSDMSSATSVLVTGRSTTFQKLSPGVRYYVRVRGDNTPVKGAYTSVTSVTLPTGDVDLRVVTWNLCGQDKCRSSSGIGSWSSRKSRAGDLIRSVDASIISTQESGDKDTNFITELPGFKRAAYMSAKSLFYDTSYYTLNRAGSLTLDSRRGRYAVWAELRHKTTGTAFVVVDPHLEPYKGRTYDDLRYAQSRSLLSQVDALNTKDLPVVFAGDFNSNKNNATYPGGYDAVRKAFLAADMVDSLDAARAADNPGRADGHAYNIAYNTANQGKVVPIKNGDHVDAIWTTPDVRSRTWKVVVDLASSGLYRTPFASDHNPLTVWMTVPGRPAA